MLSVIWLKTIICFLLSTCSTGDLYSATHNNRIDASPTLQCYEADQHFVQCVKSGGSGAHSSSTDNILYTRGTVKRLRGGGKKAQKRGRPDSSYRIYAVGGNTAIDLFTNVVESYSDDDRWRAEPCMPYAAAGCCAVRDSPPRPLHASIPLRIAADARLRRWALAGGST